MNGAGETMTATTEAVELGRTSPEDAREALLGIWAAIGPHGDPLWGRQRNGNARDRA
jgi:hypothetical protein